LFTLTLRDSRTGGNYDLISFDPRGTGRTLPFSCFPNNPEAAAISAYLDSRWYSSSDTEPGRLWTAAGIFADTCYNSLKQYGDLVGMAFTARDMMQIVDALGEDGMLRYWGAFVYTFVLLRLVKAVESRR
jgi:pimeloyl-ACP methyl ester carboxylesterase